MKGTLRILTATESDPPNALSAVSRRGRRASIPSRYTPPAMNGRTATLRVALAALTLLSLSCRRAAPEAAVPVPTPAVTAIPSPDPQTLVGRWARSDANYVIEITRVGPGGALEATYVNPQPIHVSRAEWMAKDGRVMMALELTDRNYPGNFYTLAFDPGSDSLTGVYHHLGLNQTFDVAFSRIRP